MRVLGSQGDADRAGQVQPVLVHDERRDERVEQRGGDGHRGLGRRAASTQDGELVAAEPRDGDAGAGRQREPVGDLADAARRRRGGRGCR